MTRMRFVAVATLAGLALVITVARGTDAQAPKRGEL